MTSEQAIVAIFLVAMSLMVAISGQWTKSQVKLIGILERIGDYLLSVTKILAKLEARGYDALSGRTKPNHPHITKEIPMNVDSLLAPVERTLEEKLQIIDSNIAEQQAAINEAQNRFEAETDEARSAIEVLEAKKAELAPAEEVASEDEQTEG